MKNGIILFYKKCFERLFASKELYKKTQGETNFDYWWNFIQDKIVLVLVFSISSAIFVGFLQGFFASLHHGHVISHFISNGVGSALLLYFLVFLFRDSIYLNTQLSSRCPSGLVTCKTLIHDLTYIKEHIPFSKLIINPILKFINKIVDGQTNNKNK